MDKLELYDDLCEDIQIIETDDGYMVLDMQTDQLLKDENGDICFTDYSNACKLAEELIQTRIEHYYD